MECRVYLRALEPKDSSLSIEWRNNDRIWDMLGGPKYFVSEFYEKNWVEKAILNSKELRLAICLKGSNRYIGNVYMTEINEINRSCQSHIIIGECDCWGKGYGREALLLAVGYMFNERNMNRIQANILETNTQSLRMHEKCGYRREGVLREAIYKNGKYNNQYILSLLKKDFCYGESEVEE